MPNTERIASCPSYLRGGKTLGVSTLATLAMTVSSSVILAVSSALGSDIRTFDVGNFAASQSDSCQAFRQLSNDLERSGGGIVRLHGHLVSSCKWRIAGVPVDIQGSGLATCSLTFTSPDAGIVVTEDDGHKRVSVRGCNLYAREKTAQAAIDILMPNTNAPDNSVTIDDLQIGSSDSASFAVGIRCQNCTHHEFSRLDIQGGERTIGGSPIGACLSLRGYSANGKISDLECTNASVGILESGKTEGTKISNADTVAVDHGILLDDAAHSRDPTASPFMPGPHIENWHCDAYTSCFVSRGWNQSFIDNFNFYKRPQSRSDWRGFELSTGFYGGKAFPTTHTKIALGRCAQNGTGGENICIELGEGAFANTVSGVEPDGMSYFVDEGNTSVANVLSDNNAFPSVNIFYSNQYSLSKGWRKNPSPFNRNRHNYPPLIGNEQPPILTPNNDTPSVGGCNLCLFHTRNTKVTQVVDFLNGVPGDTIRIVADDDHTGISNTAHIRTSSGLAIRMRKGDIASFVLDASTWRQF